MTNLTRDQVLQIIESAGVKGETLELRRAKLGQVDLSGINLRMANLSEADLSAAKFTGADLFRAELSRAVSGIRHYLLD